MKMDTSYECCRDSPYWKSLDDLQLCDELDEHTWLMCAQTQHRDSLLRGPHCGLVQGSIGTDHSRLGPSTRPSLQSVLTSCTGKELR